MDTYARDWTFTTALYGARPQSEAGYVEEILRRTWQLAESDIAHVLRIRSLVPHFLDYCMATVDRLAWDPTAKRLLVAYTYIKGPAASTDMNSGLAAYDLGSGGGRKWLRALYTGSFADPMRRASATQLGAVPGAFVVSGRMPLDAGTNDWEVSRTLSGVIRSAGAKERSSGYFTLRKASQRR